MTRRRKTRLIASGRSRPKQESGICLSIGHRGLATILAALRFHADENLQGTSRIPDRLIHQIATGSGAFRALGFEEVRDLCKGLKVTDKESKGTCVRPWQCPGCGRSARCSYEDLAQAGIPICTDCDRPMELQ